MDAARAGLFNYQIPDISFANPSFDNKNCSLWQPHDCSRQFGLTNPFLTTIPLNERSTKIVSRHIVERRMPSSNELLMYPTAVHAVFDGGSPTEIQFYDDDGLRARKHTVSPDKLASQKTDSEPQDDLPAKLNDTRPFDGDWISADSIENCNSLKEATKSSGNVFGSNGLLLVEACLSQKYPEFKFDDVEHDEEFKQFFNGIETFRMNEKSPSFQLPTDGAGITYYYDNIQNVYVKSYLLDERGANGSFVETHSFPHIFASGDKDSTAKILIGKEYQGAYHFAIVTMEYGQALFIPEDVIHSDSSTIGNLFVTLTVETGADTVLVKDKSSLSVVNLYP